MVAETSGARAGEGVRHVTEDDPVAAPETRPPDVVPSMVREHEPPPALPPDDALTQPTHGRTLPTTRPSDSWVQVRRWVLSDATELRAMRSDLREQLAASAPAAGGAREEGTQDNIVLVTSELATNALAHGRAPAHVSLAVDGQAVLVVVSDCDTAHAPFVASRR